MPNLPATVTYEQVFDLAVQLAGRTPENVPVSEATMLQAFCAGELRDLWKKEAWPELCDNLTEVALIDGAFSKNAGEDDEMGDILAVFDADPRVAQAWHRFAPHRITEGNGRVYVKTSRETVWVDYQLPVPDLLDASLVGPTNEAALLAVTLPERFRMALAYRGAAHLLATEDPALAGTYANAAEAELQRMASQVRKPYWRTEVRPDSPC